MSVVSCRRAISAVFSVLLMIIIVFVVGIFLYGFVSGMLKNMTTDSSSNQLFSLRIENVAINSTCMTIHVGNSLNDDVGVTKVYINSELHELLFLTDDGVIIPKSSSGPVYVLGSYTPGGMVDIKIIFNTGQSLITVVRD